MGLCSIMLPNVRQSQEGLFIELTLENSLLTAIGAFGQGR